MPRDWHNTIDCAGHAGQMLAVELAINRCGVAEISNADRDASALNSGHAARRMK